MLKNASIRELVKEVDPTLKTMVLEDLDRMHRLFKMQRQPKKGMVLTEIENLLEKIKFFQGRIQ